MAMFQQLVSLCEQAFTATQQNFRQTDEASADDDDDDEHSQGQKEGDVDKGEGAWVKTSLECMEHFLESQKYLNYISPPVNLDVYAKNAMGEKLLMSSMVKDVAKELKNQCVEDEPGTPISEKIHENVTKLKVFGRGTKGDSFFQDNTSSNSKLNVNDFFDDPLSSSSKSPKANAKKAEGPRRSARKSRQITKHKEPTKNTPIQDQEKCNDEDFPLETLGKFISLGSNPVRVVDKKYQIRDDAMNAYLNDTRDQQSLDYACKKQGLVDKAREFLVELTVYGKMQYPNRKKRRNIEEPDAGATGAYKVGILGSQFLCELRDALLCDCDYLYLEEVQYPEDKLNDNNFAKNKIKSAMLLIDNTIYNDTRQCQYFDYAKQIIHWSNRTPKKNVGPFKRGDMSRTKIKDLTIQFGYPYLFRHIGDCEHIIVFNKARLLTFDDEHRLSHFPKISWVSDIYPNLCRVDSEYLATWAVLDYAEFPENPMLVCTTCLKQFCYDFKGEKRGQFRLFPYRQLICEIPLPSESVNKKIYLNK